MDIDNTESDANIPAVQANEHTVTIKKSTLTLVGACLAFLVVGYFLGVTFGGAKITGAATGNQQGTGGSGSGGGTGSSQPVFDLSLAPFEGSQAATVVIVEYSDFQCPFCGRFYDQAYQSLKKDYIDTGKVKLYFKQFPLEQIHPNARKAGEASLCAQDQNGFWAFHDALFKNQEAWADLDATGAASAFKQYASDLGLDAAKFGTCLDSGVKSAQVDKDLGEGVQNGVQGTPTFFINGRELVGAQPFSAFKTIIDAELAK